MTTITIDPITRLEGHLAVSLEITNGKVSSARCAGTMFRGFEQILSGRDPLDAVQITQRICGVCPMDHGVASSLCLEQALGATPPDNGRILRNLILGSSFIQSHILHFYQLSALDFVDITAMLKYAGDDSQLVALRDWVKAQVATRGAFAATPFLPRYSGDYLDGADANIAAVRHYLQALQMHRLAQQMVAVFGGRSPHPGALVPGGVTSTPTVDTIEAFRAMLAEVRAFITDAYLPDVFAVAGAFRRYFEIGRGPDALLAYGVFPEDAGGTRKLLAGGCYANRSVQPTDTTRIREETRCSWSGSATGLHPARGRTEPTPGKADAYSWVKAPRYDGRVVEVGPLARVMVTHASGASPALSTALTSALRQLGLTEDAMFSAMGRHLARALECRLVADACAAWLDQLRPGKPTMAAPYRIPESGSGAGLTEAARGALGHWIEISGRVIAQYQCVVPTTWNCSPRDDQGRPGALEQALVGVPIADPDNPLEALRVVHSIDPCLACAIH